MVNQIYPMGLILTAVIMLTLPGMLFNNFTASGLNPAFALTCPGYPDVTCQNSNNSGCVSTPSACNLSGSSINLLNQQSPFTQMLSGNIFGLFSSLTSNGNQNRGPFDASGGGNYFTADCYVVGISAGVGQNITTSSFSSHINACTETNPDRSNMTKAQAFTWGNWNYNLLGASQANIPFYHIWNNATYALTCYNQGYWYLTTQASIGYSIQGCDYYKGAGYSPPQNPTVNPVYSFLVAVPCSLGVGACKAQTFPTGATHIEIFVQPQNWDTQFCTNAFTVNTQNEATWYGSQQCTNMETWFRSPHGASNFNLGLFTPLLTILLGLVLFIIGTGINLQAGGQALGTGTQVGVGTNTQGTRLAQALGLTLIVWTPLYSEFSTWFTSGILPYGLDGNISAISTGGGIIALLITAILFIGVTWQTLNIAGE